MKTDVDKNFKNARNKKYASLFVEALGVHKANWQGSLSLWSTCNLFKLRNEGV